jgi:hydrogenase maturation protease
VTADTAERQILVAGVGNAWMRDDGFGGHVAKALGRRDLPAGVTVLDFGTGGLDLAYEVMRGYDAMVLVDVSRQGGEPGTLYVLEPDPSEITPIEDGELISPHGMDPKTVLRFVRTVGGWPGKVVVVACEPAGDGTGDMGLQLSPEVAAVVERAAELVLETIDELRTETAYAEG